MVTWQHIRDPRYQVLKVEDHLRTCGGGKFKIFPLLQIRSNDTDLRKAYKALRISKLNSTIFKYLTNETWINYAEYA